MNTTPMRGRLRVSREIGSLVARTDLYQLVEKYAGPGRASGSTVTYSCPNPAHADHSPSFTVTTRHGKQSARCWSQCAWSGDALDLVRWLENLDTAAALDYLRARLGETATRQAPEKLHRLREAPPRRAPLVLLEEEPVRPPAEASARFMSKYLEARGWPESVVTTHGLEVVLDHSRTMRVRHKYLCPVGGEWRVTYWQDRGPNSSRVKWLSPKGARPIPYNLRSLEQEQLSAVVVCEGPADTITAELALDSVPGVAVIGVPGANAWQADWGRLLDGCRVVIAADPDTAGERLEAAVRASTRGPVAVVRLAHGDLTETARTMGGDAVREILLAGIGQHTAPLDRTLEESVRLLLEAFPGAVEVKP